MSILIRGMEMPKNCKDCALYIEGACYAKGYRDYRSIMDTAKPDDCPLVELPPHGRLADLDEMIEDYCDRMTWIRITHTLVKCPYCGAVQLMRCKCKDCKRKVIK